MSEEKRDSHVNRLQTLLFAVLFLLGGTIGYIVRDVRADRQVMKVAAATQEAITETAADVASRARRAGSDMVGGMRVAADSAQAAVEEFTRDTSDTPASTVDTVSKERKRNES